VRDGMVRGMDEGEMEGGKGRDRVGRKRGKVAGNDRGMRSGEEGQKSGVRGMESSHLNYSYTLIQFIANCALTVL
jgi:hypothetical protein